MLKLWFVALNDDEECLVGWLCALTDAGVERLERGFSLVSSGGPCWWCALTIGM